MLYQKLSMLFIILFSGCATIISEKDIQENSIDKIKVGITKGANINRKDENGMTPLMLAASYNSIDIAKLLIEKGANINETTDFFGTALMCAVVRNSIDVAKLLIEKGADINARNDSGDTVLMRAALGNSIDVAKLLIEKGADINARNDSGDTALMCAAIHNSIDVFELLLKPLELNVYKGQEDQIIYVIAKVYGKAKEENSDKVIEVLKKKFPFQIIKMKMLMFGMIDTYNDRYVEGIQSYDILLKIDPLLSELWTLKGSNYFILENYDKAYECFVKALKINPTDKIAKECKDKVIIALNIVKEVEKSKQESEYEKRDLLLLVLKTGLENFKNGHKSNILDAITNNKNVKDLFDEFVKKVKSDAKKNNE